MYYHCLYYLPQINKRKVKYLVDKGYRASIDDLTMTNGEIHDLLVTSRDIKLTKIAATAYKQFLLDKHKRNIEMELEKLDKEQVPSHLHQYF